MGEETPPILKENIKASTDVVIDEKNKVTISEPNRWKVILLNDDSTPMEFVIHRLIEVFRHTPETAERVTVEVHQSGSGIAGIYSFEIAEAKAVEATNLARTNSHPLQIKLEEE